MEWSPSGFLTAGGKRLEYACFGPPPDQAPTIVLLHEGLGCVALWRDFPKRLETVSNKGVFVYSRAGYGQSDPVALPRPLDYMTREAVETLPEVLDMIGARDVILLGHSDGATISAIYAGTVSDSRVKGVILMAPHFFTEPEGLESIAQAKTAYETTDLPKKMAKYHRDPDNAFHGWNGAWLDPGFKAWNVADVIGGIRAPILAIQGAGDQYGTLAQIDEITKRAIAQVAVAILPDTRHAPYLESPEATLEAIAKFLANLEL
ncbi:MAG: alpha/beta hydrolase [Paracoccaceae bacterium]|jgi:pimeloyl-ACP methyl ester carboxylesterase|nr:alpha/beta hydrolase [Paracoccaceae bacterium]MDP7186070.1 alpha/beta hydrolase [Paracoccaceae bacterium]